MSGRIPPNRPGFGNVEGYPPGYGCIEIPVINIDCTDCDDNNYRNIPRYLEGVLQGT